MKERRSDRQMLAEDYGITVPPHVSDETLKEALDNMAANCASMGLPFHSALRGLMRFQQASLVNWRELGSRLRAITG